MAKGLRTIQTCLVQDANGDWSGATLALTFALTWGNEARLLMMQTLQSLVSVCVAYLLSHHHATWIE